VTLVEVTPGEGAPDAVLAVVPDVVGVVEEDEPAGGFDDEQALATRLTVATATTTQVPLARGPAPRRRRVAIGRVCLIVSTVPLPVSPPPALPEVRQLVTNGVVPEARD